MKLIKITLIAVLLALLSCNFLWARTTSSDEAEMVVTGWVKGHPQPLGMTLGRDVTRAETFMNDEGQPAYHIVYLRPTGFVIVSADDLVEPIIGFVNGSTYDPSPENPLGALVSRDLNGRIEAARNAFQTLGTTIQTVETKTQNKWKYFSDLAEKPDNEFKLLSDEPYGRGCLINDIWVAPFVQSKWNQGSIPGDSLMYCYNYYTPNHYPSGCVATAGAVDVLLSIPRRT